MNPTSDRARAAAADLFLEGQLESAHQQEFVAAIIARHYPEPDTSDVIAKARGRRNRER